MVFNSSTPTAWPRDLNESPESLVWGAGGQGPAVNYAGLHLRERHRRDYHSRLNLSAVYTYPHSGNLSTAINHFFFWLGSAVMFKILSLLLARLFHPGCCRNRAPSCAPFISLLIRLFTAMRLALPHVFRGDPSWNRRYMIRGRGLSVTVTSVQYGVLTSFLPRSFLPANSLPPAGSGTLQHPNSRFFTHDRERIKIIYQIRYVPHRN